jgi:hypothetical protein
MTKLNYYVSALKRDPKWGLIEFLPGVNRAYRLKEGVRMGDDFPASVELAISPSSGNLIPDFIPNVNKQLMISEPVRKLFESEGLTDELVEYLPFILKNKKGRVVDAPRYCVANPLRKINCLDRKRSKYAARDDGVTIVVMEVLHLLEESIPADAKLFRLGELPSMILLRSDLADRIREANFIGLMLRSPGENLRL